MLETYTVYRFSKYFCFCFALFSLFYFFNVSAIHAQNNQSGALTAHDARIVGDIKQTRFVVDLSNQVKFSVFTLADPYRVIIDMSNVKFRLPPGSGNQGRGLILAYRYGLFAPGKSRIVIDLIQPSAIRKAYVLPAKGDQPARLVVEFIPTDRQNYLAIQKEQREKRLREIARQKRQNQNNSSFQAQIDELNRTGRSNQQPVIVLDPGHGGIDPGAIGVNGTKEKEVVLAFAELLKEELHKKGNYKVVLTRASDVFVTLGGRVKFARRKGANLFVSIHADSIARKDASVRGATVYTLSEKASDEQARKLAISENKSDIVAGVDLNEIPDDTVSNILFSLARRETKDHSVAFANTLIKSMRQSTRVKKEALRFANFVVLRAPDVPSVLIELGYLSSSRDEKLLLSQEWRKKVAGSIATAINNYFSNGAAPRPY